MTETKENISPAGLKQAMDSGGAIELVDVRNFDEFQQRRLSSARLIPLPQLPLRFTEIDTAKSVYVFCKAGTRSRRACHILQKLGITAASLEGGIDAWQKAGYPLIEGKKGLSVERQTRIAIGSLVLLGLLIPKFLWWLPWFVGAMLIFAGISGTCLMMRFLAAMPWNREGI